MWETMKKREANFELLRIIAMMMIITLHYLDKGGILVPLSEDRSAVNLTAWAIEALAICSVNCYVLISGYFLAESGWRAGRVAELLCEILFYSLLVPLIMIALGALDPHSIGHYDIFGWIFPIGTEAYWFMSAYVIMYILAPLLAAGAHALTKEQLKCAVILLILFESAEKTVLPVKLATDRMGYDFGWFICLFLTAVYIRLYGIRFMENKRTALAVYLLSALGIWAVSTGASVLASKDIKCMKVYAGMPYSYNYLLCLTEAVGLFYMFKNMKVKENTAADAVRAIAPLTLGVYLLHEHTLIREQWPVWLNVSARSGKWSFIPYMLLCIVIVFAVGVLVDYIRELIFRGIKSLPARKDRRE